MSNSSGYWLAATKRWPKVFPIAEQKRWLDRCAGEVPTPVDSGRLVRIFVKRRLKEGCFLHSYYVSTLSLPSKGLFMAYYNQRGGAEVEQFRNDKSGLNLTARRKQRFLAQKGYILLTDLAHNLLADFHHHALVGSRFEGYGPKLCMPGKLTFVDGKIAKIELPSQKQFSKDLLICLERYCLGS